MSVIKNIRTVQFIEAKKLSNIAITQMGVFLRYWRDWKTLPATGLSSLSVASSVQNKSRVFTSKLTTHLTSHFDVDNRHLCFLATAVDGSRYLIGTGEPPYPVANTEDIMPDNPEDKSGCSLSVELKDTFGLLEVLD